MASAIYPSLADRLVVITGGGTGLGAAMVAAFARQGAEVYFLDIAEKESKELAHDLRASLHPPAFVRCDLLNVEEINAVLGDIAATAGAVEVLVNNAGNDDRHEFSGVSAAYWDERIAVNLRHHFFCAQAVAPGMKAMGKGVILNLGSTSWHVVLANLSIYMTAKAGIEGLTRGLARDLGGFGIRVNCIVPGAVRTARQMRLWQSPESEARIIAAQCLPQRIDPEHVAAMALFLASDDASRCSGRNYFVDAGWFGS
jgi:NAD(P)-dependent dehydrogenase (short-subunit alcohol dehydrogenase family)